MTREAFAHLTPEVVLAAVETSYGLSLGGVITPFASYVNRVYGIAADDGSQYVVKFYRPGRWSEDAILEEHQFLADCLDAELPVVPPLADEDGATLSGVVVDDASGEEREYLFALFPKRAGRTFDADRDDDWVRLGALLGRIHAVGRSGEAVARLVCRPDEATRRFIRELQQEGVADGENAGTWFALVETALETIGPMFDGQFMHRIHGDCHRGNILDRSGEGLLLIDFDDMMIGPPVQDLWLLLPERRSDSLRELNLLLEGYETFLPFERATLDLIEPLRLMRIVYFLAWSARQRDDARFRQQNPDWGSDAFWIKEVEDMRTQLQAIMDELE